MIFEDRKFADIGRFSFHPTIKKKKRRREEIQES
jgi:hypothetical protein